MEIVNERVHRVLAYIEALNRHGVRPDRWVVDEFAMRPEPKPSTTVNPLQTLTAGLLQQVLLSWQTETIEGETFCEYLARLAWIEDTSDVELTPIGRALLKALNSPVLEETTADVFEIVLDPENPFAYAQALGALSLAKRALLVEPYFRLEQLMDVAEFENIERVLLGPGLKKRELEVLATGLAALPEGRSLEVRIAYALHDRYLIPREDGRVMMLGMSLGGIGKKVSTITTLGELASMALREAHEALWRDAETLAPKSYAANATTSEPDAKATVEAPTPKKDAPAKKSVSSAPKKRAAKVRGN